MSRRRDPRAEAIAYITGLSDGEAAMFLSVLGDVIKSRHLKAQASTPSTSTKRDKPQMAKATTTSTAASTRSRAALREVKVTDPNQPAEPITATTTAGGEGDAQPANQEGQLALS